MIALMVDSLKLRSSRLSDSRKRGGLTPLIHDDRIISFIHLISEVRGPVYYSIQVASLVGLSLQGRLFRVMEM